MLVELSILHPFDTCVEILRITWYFVSSQFWCCRSWWTVWFFILRGLLLNFIEQHLGSNTFKSSLYLSHVCMQAHVSACCMHVWNGHGYVRRQYQDETSTTPYVWTLFDLYHQSTWISMQMFFKAYLTSKAYINLEIHFIHGHDHVHYCLMLSFVAEHFWQKKKKFQDNTGVWFLIVMMCLVLQDLILPDSSGCLSPTTN